MREILFICTGNLCRSPLAASLFQQAIEALGASIEVTSAGLWAVEGAPPPWELLQLGKEEGLDLSRHKARPVNRASYRKADLVIVMERGQKEALSSLYGDEEGKLHLLSEFSAGKFRGKDIDDPFERSIAHFRSSLEQIREGISGLLRYLGAPI